MRKFGLRLFLIRKLIESLMWSCIDEYTEYEEIADGLAKAHSAMEKRRRTEKVDPCQIERMKLLAKHGNCFGANEEWNNSGNSKKGMFCDLCSMGSGESGRPDYWSCNREGESAKRWLAEHGIKE